MLLNLSLCVLTLGEFFEANSAEKKLTGGRPLTESRCVLTLIDSFEARHAEKKINGLHRESEMPTRGLDVVVVRAAAVVALVAVLAYLQGWWTRRIASGQAAALLHGRHLMQGFPHVYWINLDRSPDRAAKTRAALDGLGVQHTRVQAVDGSTLRCRVDGASAYDARGGTVRCATCGTALENACTASHVLALQALLRGPDDAAVVMEDDVSFELLPMWRATWSEYRARFPADADVVQLGVILTDYENVRQLSRDTPVPRTRAHWFSNVAYYVTRPAAQHILAHFGAKALGVQGPPGPGGLIDIQAAATAAGTISHADILLYGLCRHVYTLPLFTYTAQNSLLHMSHLPAHRESKRVIQKFWQGEHRH